MRASRRGHDADVILARGSQYSTQPASTSHTFSTKLQLGKKEKRWILTFAECLAEILLIPYARTDDGCMGAARQQAQAAAAASRKCSASMHSIGKQDFCLLQALSESQSPSFFFFSYGGS